MTKARLIKKQDVEEQQIARHPRQVKRPVVKKKVDAMVEWIENQRNQRQDPRKAFAALFAQPQPQ